MLPDIDRRTLIAGAVAAAALAAGGPLRAAATRRPIGLQLYTLRTLFAADPIGTLKRVARIGYREVEIGGAGYEAMDHRLLRRAMDQLGLTAPSLHVGIEMLRTDQAGAVRMARTLGAGTLVVPWVGEDQRGVAAWDRLLSDLSRFGRSLRAEGLALAWHNHDFEFTPRPDGTLPFDRLLAECDPDLVGIELDVFWAVRAKIDAVALIERLKGRIFALHLKDMTQSGAMAAVGAGTIDFAAILKRSAASGVRHLYVENDDAPAPYIPDITASLQALRRMGI